MSATFNARIWVCSGLCLMLGLTAGLGWPSLRAQLSTASTLQTPTVAGGRNILYYRHPMGLPDTSPTPKKDSMGMPYIPVYADEAAASAAPPRPARQVLYYRNPMGLPDTSPTPKKDSMGMPYIPVYADEAHDAASVYLEPGRQQLLGVSTRTAGVVPLFRQIRAPGQFSVDERRQVTISPKFAGWVERQHVNTTGQKVQAGDVLLDIYSPELVNAQQEYLLARQAQQTLQLDPVQLGQQRMGLADGALQRLRFWDISEGDLGPLIRAGKINRSLPLRSPVSGIVLEKKVERGTRFDAGTPLYEIADLSQLWLLVDIFEADLNLVRLGQTVKVQVHAYPGEQFEGKITFISPTLNASTRTVSVRIELANPQGRLKPAMFAEAHIQADLGQPQISIPESAVIDSGVRQLVLIKTAPGRFAPQPVSLGQHGLNTDGERYVQVRSGLAVGAAYVERANFLLDSESNLKAALSSLAGAVSAVETNQPALAAQQSSSLAHQGEQTHVE